MSAREAQKTLPGLPAARAFFAQRSGSLQLLALVMRRLWFGPQPGAHW